MGQCDHEYLDPELSINRFSLCLKTFANTTTTTVWQKNNGQFVVVAFFTSHKTLTLGLLRSCSPDFKLSIVVFFSELGLAFFSFLYYLLFLLPKQKNAHWTCKAGTVIP
jgi:hypothetical protein